MNNVFQNFLRDGQNQNTRLTPKQPGGEISSADTNLHALVNEIGTNTGTRTATTFQLTAIDTTGVSYLSYILQITETGFEQERRIVGETLANPGVVTIQEAFDPALPAAGDVDFQIFPYLSHPLTFDLDAGATGTLSLYRGNDNDVRNLVAVLSANQQEMLYVNDPRNIYYAFSVNAATEKFRWGTARKWTA